MRALGLSSGQTRRGGRWLGLLLRGDRPECGGSACLPRSGVGGECSQEREEHVQSCQAGGSLVSQGLGLLGGARTHFDGTAGREGTAKWATECQGSPPLTPRRPHCRLPPLFCRNRQRKLGTKLQ